MANSPFMASVALTSALTVLAGSAAARECLRADGQVRRIEIAVQDPDRGVPCEVVYWKDTEEPGVRRVLWSAQTDAAFCKRKADELAANLAAVGWTCTPTDEPAAVREAAPQAPATDDRAKPTVATAPAVSQPAPAVSQPAPDVSQPAPDVSQPAPDVSQPAPDPAPVAAAEPETETEVEPSIRAALAPQQGTSAAAAPGEDALATIIEQNLARLNDGVDGSFDATIADYGDLDGDGYQDGLVLFTYESQRLGQARFVAAYLFDGKSYALAATKPLAGSEEQVQGTEIESIDGGVISLRLSILEPGDAACCPSGIRHQALILRNGQLIEVNASASTAESRS